MILETQLCKPNGDSIPSKSQSDSSQALEAIKTFAIELEAKVTEVISKKEAAATWKLGKEKSTGVKRAYSNARSVSNEILSILQGGPKGQQHDKEQQLNQR
jgi:hypothetical protein